MAHALSHTATTVGTGSKTEMWDQTLAGGSGPLEWEITTDQDIDVYFSGVYPSGEDDNPVRYLAGETKYFANKNRSITKIEMQAVSSAATVSLRPSIV